MKKIFQKFKNHKYRNLICMLGLVLVFIILPRQVYALTEAILKGIIDGILYGIGEFFGFLVTLLIGFLMKVAAYNDFTTSEAVRLGWKLMRDVCNMFFIVILMVIAICTIIRVEAYNYKKMLPTLLVKAVLINFSLLFCGLLIDASQVVTLTFVGAFKDAGVGNFITGLGINKIYAASTSGNPSVGTTSTLFYGILLLALATVVIAALVFVFLGRIIAFWILIVLSPFAFLASASGGIGSKYSDQWWSEFTKYLLVGPVLAFFLWLSLSIMRGAALGAITGTMSSGLPSVGFSEAGTPDNFVAFCISMAMLLGSLVAAQQIGVAGSGMAGKTLGGVKAAGAFVAKGIPSYANESLTRFSGWATKGKFSLNLNAMDYIDAWKESREDKHRKRLEKSRGTIRDVAEYGFGKYVGNKIIRGLPYGKGGFGLRDVRFANAQKNLDYEQEKDKMRMELGGDANAAGKKRLEDKTNERDKIETDMQNNENAKDVYKFQRNVAERKLEKEAKKRGEAKWRDESGMIIDQVKWKKEHDDKEGEYDAQYTELNKKWISLNNDINKSEAAITMDAINEENDKVNSKEQEIKNINDGYLSDKETHDKLAQIESRLSELGAITKEGGKLNYMQIQEKADLKLKQKDLKEYKTSLEAGQTVDRSIFGNIENITKSYEGVKKGEIEKSKKSETKVLQEEADRHRRRAEVMEETKGKAGGAEYDYATIQKRMVDRKKEIEELEEKRMAMSGPDKFYRESARRALVAEEQKKIADVKESSELVSLLKKAQHEGDFYKFSAILKQLANNGDDNEALNGYGYMSNFEGMKDFFRNEVVGKMGVTEQESLALANDVAYLNEGRNHWETARVAKNKDGAWEWNTEREHTQAALAELLKKNDRELAQKLNRLAYGGEKQNEDGSRTFQFSNLGKALMYNLGSSFDHLFVNRKEGTSNLIFNIRGDRAFLDELRRNSAITENFYNFVYSEKGTRKPSDWYEYVTRSNR